jgi:hypothetical protein
MRSSSDERGWRAAGLADVRLRPCCSGRSHGRALAAPERPGLEHLHGVFAWIAARQHDRDAARLANPKVTLRAKKRLRAAAS